MAILYSWRYDASYYATVIDRYYQQLPFVLQLPTQFTLLWLIGIGTYFAMTHAALRDFAGWALAIGAIGIPALVVLTKRAILLKYRLRLSFGTEASYSLADAGVSIQAKSVHGTYPWSEYSRAVRFSDGMLLLRNGAMRWLPDSALQRGTVEEALALVRSHLPMRFWVRPNLARGFS